MGRFVVGADRSHASLFPACVEDWIDAGNPVRVIDASVDALDLAALGFAGVTPAATGRPGRRASPRPFLSRPGPWTRERGVSRRPS